MAADLPLAGSQAVPAPVETAALLPLFFAMAMLDCVPTRGKPTRSSDWKFGANRLPPAANPAKARYHRNIARAAALAPFETRELRHGTTAPSPHVASWVAS